MQKILKISALKLAENAFPTFWTHQFVVKMLVTEEISVV